jgi:hypothetical protein
VTSVTEVTLAKKYYCDMRRRWCQVGAQGTAVLVLLALAVDLLLKDKTNLQQVFWSCYWGALAVAVGIVMRSSRLVASGVVFFVGVGSPAWLLGRLAEEQLDPTSVLIHFLPLIAGALYITQLSRLPRYSAAGAWLLHAAPLAMARIFCDPAANINMAHASWPPLTRFLPHLWEFHVLVLATSAATVTLAAWAIDHVLASRAQLQKLAETPAKAA